MTSKPEGEVSTFTLDAYWASGKPADATLEQHLAGCARCRAYLASLDHDAGRLPSSVTVPAAPARRRRRWALPSAVATVLALAACALLLVRGRPTEPGYVGAKGTPAVELLLHRRSDTWIWDGRSPVRPGDALALRVSCEGLQHVAVAAPGARGWTRLSEATCPGPDEALPFTLVVDDQPGDERLAVVLSRDALDDESLRRAVLEEQRAGDVWTVAFLLTKTTEIER
jgi:hypothetical protein